MATDRGKCRVAIDNFTQCLINFKHFKHSHPSVIVTVMFAGMIESLSPSTTLIIRTKGLEVANRKSNKANVQLQAILRTSR